MRGRHYANVFVHFEPLDHAEMNKIDDENRILRGEEPLNVKRRHGAQRSLRAPANSNQKKKNELTNDKGTLLRIAAATGNLDEVHRLLIHNPELVHDKDSNNWEALHEAIRAGQTDCVKYLVDMGSDLGSKVRDGGTALWLARRDLPEGHEIIEYLVGIGAPEE
jgi:ankyrin repeat protein